MRDKRPLFFFAIIVLATVGAAAFFGRTTEPPELTIENSPPPAQQGGVNPEWMNGVRYINSGINELLMNPDPNRVGEFVDPTCPCFKEITDLMRQHQRDGTRHAEPAVVLVRATLFQQVSPDEVQLNVTLRTPPTGPINRDGLPVATKPAHQGVSGYTIKRGTDQVWRLAARGEPHR